ncbi:uncharacterized protein LOC131475559 [Solea solea]|uniref:uncharacterized protein LOC131475559 n=1 Tax=Solea solea TaxID=90069 RepID=UPI00272BFD95|nr:uncharacterized protein LOC131475559 [Solea solea]
MSLLSSVEQAIKSCKAEQTRINDSIQLYRELLQCLTPQTKSAFHESECADTIASETNTSPGVKEDIELLERVLEKALQVRTGSRTSTKDPDRHKQSRTQKETGSSSSASKDIAVYKGSQTTVRSTAKSASVERKEHKKRGASVSSTLGSRTSANKNQGHSKITNNRSKPQFLSAEAVHHGAARKLQQAGSVSVAPGRISALHAKNKTIKSSVLRGDDLGKAAAISTPSSNNPGHFSHTDVAGVQGLPQHDGITEQITKWKSLRKKENRLWDKVIALQRNPMPGRCHFMERMRLTFPKDQPCGSSEETRVLVDKFAHPGRHLTNLCQTEELRAKGIPRAATQPGTETTKYGSSYLTCERMSATPAELQKHFAHPVKQEVEAWDRWRPEGARLCPSGANSMWEDELISPLPPTISYTTESELRELEKLRMRVVLLKQEINLEQALLDTLSPQLSSIAPGPGCLNYSVLRDIYSLLGEGGVRFPATVLDTEPD